VGIQVEKLRALTGLRFIAAAFILVHHGRAFHIQEPPLLLDHGVSLFFVLSGFILSHVHPKLVGCEAIRTFLILRVARIWPAHVVTLLAAAVLFQPVVDGKLVANLLLVQAWIPLSPWYFSFNGVSWSISTEFFFYLAFPLLIWKWRTTFWWKWIATAGLIFALCAFASDTSMPLRYSPEDLVTAHGLLFINPLGRLLEFVTGIVAYSCFTWLRPRVASFNERSVIVTVVAMSLAELSALAVAGYFLFAAPLQVYLARYIGDGPWIEWSIHAGSFPSFAVLIIIFGIGIGYISRALSGGLAVFLGEISYSVYLLHQIVYTLYLRNWPPGADPDYLGLIVCVAVTLILATVLWRAVEIPCRAWVKELAGLGFSPQTLHSTMLP